MNINLHEIDSPTDRKKGTGPIRKLKTQRTQELWSKISM